MDTTTITVTGRLYAIRLSSGDPLPNSSDSKLEIAQIVITHMGDVSETFDVKRDAEIKLWRKEGSATPAQFFDWFDRQAYGTRWHVAATIRGTRVLKVVVTPLK